MDYAVRLTPSGETDVSGALKYIVANCASAVVVEHSPTNGAGKELHYHIHVEGLSISDTSLNRSLTRFKVPPGNKGRSVKTKYDKDNPKPVDRGNIRYISKGRLEPVLLHNISYQEYEVWRSQWVQRSAETNTPEPVRADKKKKVTDYDIYEEIRDILENVPYVCSCKACQYDNEVASEHGLVRKIRWGYSDVHRHINYVEDTIFRVRNKYRRKTSERVMHDFCYMVYNNGRSMESGRSLGYLYRRANPTLFAQYQ